MDALAPVISKETLEYHYGKHHKAYVDKLNQLIAGTDLAGRTLEQLVMSTEGAIFNNAAQVWNHTFYWNCLTPKKGGAPDGEIKKLIDKHFTSFDQFKDKFLEAATTQFGSGWAWLTQDDAGALHIEKTPNAENPMTKKRKPVFTCDVWEHAYYIDYRNDRAKYVKTFWDIVNWDFVNEQLARR
jgi:Fe-Mn family superoxide dismutase